MLLLTTASPLLAVLFLVLGVTAHGRPKRPDWVRGLDDCWQKCLEDTDDGCKSSKCICDSSQSDRYLPPASSCITHKCDASEFTFGLAFLLPLQSYCQFVRNPIPDEVVSSARAVATESAIATTTAKKPQQTQKPKPSKSQEEITKVTTTTLTTTTTESGGKTIVILVPVVISGDDMSTGTPVTTTLSNTNSPSTAAPSATPESPAPASTQQQPQSNPATETKASERRPGADMNGGLSEGLPGAANQMAISGVVIGLGLMTGLFLRL